MRRLLALFLLFFATAAAAQLSIEITGAGAQRIPIAIAPFAGEGALVQGNASGISTIVRADLERGLGVLEKLTGRRPTLFRPPIGHTNPVIARAADELDPACAPGAARMRLRQRSQQALQ